MQGRFTGEVEVIDGGFRVNGKELNHTKNQMQANYLGAI